MTEYTCKQHFFYVMIQIHFDLIFIQTFLERYLLFSGIEPGLSKTAHVVYEILYIFVIDLTIICHLHFQRIRLILGSLYFDAVNLMLIRD